MRIKSLLTGLLLALSAQANESPAPAAGLWHTHRIGPAEAPWTAAVKPNPSAVAAHVVDIPEPAAGMEHVPLSSLEIEKATCGWGTNKADKSIDGNAITLCDTVFSSGVGTHAPGRIIVKLNGSVTRFHTCVGIDDEVAHQADLDGYARADYRVWLKAEDGSEKVVAEGTVTGKDACIAKIDVDVRGWKYLFLETLEGNDGTNWADHVDWANAYFEFQYQNSTRPAIVSEDEIQSKLNCATNVFSQPGVRFIHKVRATNPDAAVAVRGLPEGLRYDESREWVEGIVETEGAYSYFVDITADGETATEEVKLVVSKQLQQPVPFMGWISWNSVESEVSEDIVKQVADIFEDKGLQACGWNMIMLDDWWHADERAADGKPVANAKRFPNGLRALSDYLHEKGMLFGIYSDAAPLTCAGAYGSYGYESIDAKQYAEWGVDVVKYDYCGAPDSRVEAERRYKAMGDALKASGRNMIFYICEWGIREPWKWGVAAGGSCWRTTLDTRDCWEGRDTGVGVLQSINGMKHLANWQGVNRFNDADMLCTGLHGTGKASNDLCLTGPGMTQDEYRTQFALWCMWSSPLALSFDPRSEKITADDYKIITNTELIALDQDRTGQQADLVAETADYIIFAKDCENGDIALSFTNLSETVKNVSLDFNDLPHLKADRTYLCRDLWMQRPVDNVQGKMKVALRPHATRVFRLTDANAAGVAPDAVNAKVNIVPVKGRGVKVETEGLGNAVTRIIVTDVAGRVVMSKNTRESSVTLDLPANVYMVQAVANGVAAFSKVIL